MRWKATPRSRPAQDRRPPGRRQLDGPARQWAVDRGGRRRRRCTFCTDQSAGRLVALAAGTARPHARVSIDAPVELDGKRLAGCFETYVVGPLDLSLQLPETVLCQDQPVIGRLRIFNAGNAREVTVELAGEGLRIEPARQVVSIGSLSSVGREFRLPPLGPGRRVLRVSARAGSERGQCEETLDVDAARATPEMLRQVRSAAWCSTFSVPTAAGTKTSRCRSTG